MSDRPRIGHVVAMRTEARCLSENLSGAPPRFVIRDDVLLELAGIGARRATAAARALHGAPVHALVSFGTCGALIPGLAGGALVLATTVLNGSGERYGVDRPWRARLVAALPRDVPIHEGPLVQAPAVVRTPEDKAQLHATTGADAVDMESAAVAEVAAAAELPFLAVRVVSDAAQTTIPASALAAVDACGEVHLWRCLAALLRRPRDLPRLLEMRRESAAAYATLRRIATAAGPDLCFQVSSPTQ